MEDGPVEKGEKSCAEAKAESKVNKERGSVSHIEILSGRQYRFSHRALQFARYSLHFCTQSRAACGVFMHARVSR